jgi:hypothetical protein
MIKLKTLLEDTDQNNNGYPDSTEGSSNNELHINLRAVYAILKANNLGPKITDGNRITGIKLIDFGSYDEKTGEDGGRLSIDSTGELYGQDNWGMTIKDANDVMDAVDQYRKDQKEQGYTDSTEGSTNNEFTSLLSSLESDLKTYDGEEITYEDDADTMEITVSIYPSALKKEIAQAVNVILKKHPLFKIDKNTIDRYRDEDGVTLTFDIIKK